MSPNATVFVIDDDADVRESLQRLLKTVGLRSEAFSSAQDFMRRGVPERPSCLILDVRLPELGGLDLQHKLNAAGINIPVIFITAHADVPLAVKAMKSGAIEFLSKPFRDQDLLDAVEQALQRDELARQEESKATALQDRYEELTAREREVMRLVASGLQTKEIASRLGLSEITAAVHRGHVMQKMQAASPAELGRMAEKLKLPSIK